LPEIQDAMQDPRNQRKTNAFTLWAMEGELLCRQKVRI
jgi:hypothetical protein